MGYEWDFAVVLKTLPFILKGVKFTLLLSALGWGVGALIGLLVALLRLAGVRVLGALLSVYVDVFRSLPDLVVLFWFFYAIPILTGLQPSALVSASVALGIAAGATLSEIFRSGILSISGGQWEAAFALAMTTRQAYRRIVLPQAIVRMLPPLVSTAISMIKASSLAAAVGVAELMWQGTAMMLWTYRRVEIYTVIAVVYFGLTYPQALLVNYIHARLLPKG